MIFFENLEGEGGEERPPSEKDHRHDGEDQVTSAPMEKWQNCEMAKTQWLKSHDGDNYVLPKLLQHYTRGVN